MDNILTSRLAAGDVLLADGALGTNLFAAGLQTGDAPELWNLEHPDRIRALHASFVQSGSDVILTNTFGGTHYRLALHNAGHQVAQINRAAVEIAREAALDASQAPLRNGHRVIVAGSMGPTGEILAPNGSVSIDDARRAFAEQAEALCEAGVDVLWIETLSSAEEIEAAILAAADTGLPIVCTVSIDTNGRTMMGLTAADTVALTARLPSGVAGVGTNCGVGASEVVAAVANLHAANQAVPAERRAVLVAKANCGIPEWQDGAIVYNGTPALMADYARMARDAGARIIGGCCGTTSAHVRAMRDALDRHPTGAAPDVDSIVARLGEISQGARAQLAGDLSVAGGSASGRTARSSRRRRRD